MDLKHRILQESFGYTTFRPGQERLIDAILNGQDVLAVMPTGAGKSLCYQIPALLLPGITLVVSPLISLMNDQLRSLSAKGIAACVFHSGQTMQERSQAQQMLKMGRCKLVYAAPERLVTPEFFQMIEHLPISMIAVDEAHCISQWGHDFRPPYRQIPKLIHMLPHRPIISAFTATATPQVRDDITQALTLHHPVRLVTSFDRPNLSYEVKRAYNRESYLLQFLQTQQDASGIIYCLTRKKTEEYAKYLRDNDIKAIAYHAGMDSETRREAQYLFQTNAVRVIVATNAFGMGIDKPDVRFVVHLGMPQNLENYYQEAGRAGRDGAPARCILLFDESDIDLQEFFIHRDPENPALSDEEVKWIQKQNLARLERMKRYVFSDKCLRSCILKYFGQDAPDFCGNCSICEDSSIEKDITVDAQKILSCVYRAKEQCDTDALCSILRGEMTECIEQKEFDKLSTFGLMKKVKLAQIKTMISRLISLGYLIRQEDPEPRLRLCARAKQVLFHHEKVTMRVRVPRERIKLERVLRGSEHTQLAALLYEERKKLARRKGVPMQNIISDLTLEFLANNMPINEKELHRMLPERLRGDEAFARQMLPAIQKYCAAHV